MTTSCREYKSESSYSPQSRQKTGLHVFRWKGGTSKRSAVKKKKRKSSEEEKKTSKTFLGSEYSMVCKICGHACSSNKKSSIGCLANMALPVWAPGPGNGKIWGDMRRDKRGIIRERGENEWCKQRVREERRKGWAYSLIAICCIQLAPKGIKCMWSIRLISVS